MGEFASPGKRSQRRWTSCTRSKVWCFRFFTLIQCSDAALEPNLRRVRLGVEKSYTELRVCPSSIRQGSPRVFCRLGHAYYRSGHPRKPERVCEHDTGRAFAPGRNAVDIRAAPRPMKAGTIASPWRYGADASREHGTYHEPVKPNRQDRR